MPPLFQITRAASLRATFLLAAGVMLVALALSATAAQAAPVYRATADVAPLTPVDTTTATQLFGPNVDDQSIEITAPFPVAVYGNVYTTLTVSSNGHVGLGSGTIGYLSSSDSTDFGTPVVSAFNQDLYTADSGGIYIETRGTAPDRQAVIEWNVTICCNSDPVTARLQAIFTEGIATVETRYAGTIDYPGWMGIKRNGVEFTRYGADENNAYPAQDTRISYAPLSVDTAALGNDATPAFTGYADPSEVVEVKVYAGTDTTVAPARTLTVSPDAAGDYSVSPLDADKLDDGAYTVQATQASGSTPTMAFTIDATAPVVSLTGPPARTAENAPSFTGTSGSAAGDDAALRVEIYAGTSTDAGPAIDTLNVAGGDYSVSPSSPLADGTYTARSVQGDEAGNQGVSAPVTFTVDTTAPDAKLTAPANGAETAESKPAFAGTGGTAAGDGDVEIAVRAGTATSGAAVQTLRTTVAADGTFTVSPTSALALGQYTARVTQADDLGHTATGPAVTFTVVAPKAEPAKPIVEPAKPTTVAVCKSRRLIYKHVRRPSGTNLRVVATLDGVKIKRTIGRREILIPVDLRGKPAATYTLRVSVTRTLKNGKRKTVKTVTRFAYRTCA